MIRAGRPNKRMHSTPLRGPKIAAILTSGFRPTVVPIFRCGAGDAQGVRRAYPIPDSQIRLTLHRVENPSVLFQKKASRCLVRRLHYGIIREYTYQPNTYL
jgi:hypothetical protein